jgi:hypothetical protein
VDAGRGGGELRELPAAPATRRAELAALGEDDDLDDLPVARRDHGGDGGALASARRASSSVTELGAALSALAPTGPATPPEPARLRP